MSQTSNWLSRAVSAAAASCGRSGRGSTLIIGSIWKSRTEGFSARIATIASMLAWISWRFIAAPRCFANGLKTPPSPPAQEKNEISLIGEIQGASLYSLSTRVAALANSRNELTNSAEKMSR